MQPSPFDNLATHASPPTVDAACELVCEAFTRKQPVFPRGGGTKKLPPTGQEQNGLLLNTTNLAELIDFPVRDLTVTVQAGMTIGKLQSILGQEGLELPIDVPLPEQATVGGCLAANTSGPRRTARGTLRDYLIGFSYVNDRAEVVSAGGRVVKNVAGYDLMKLHIGALGTLGLITQATFKVVPRAQARAWVLFGIGTAALGPTLDRLHEVKSRPIVLDVLNAAARIRLQSKLHWELPSLDPWLVCLGFEEKPDTVAWQVQTCLNELHGPPRRELRAITDSAEAYIMLHALTEATLAPELPSAAIAGVLASKLAVYLTELDARPELLLYAHAGSGVVRLHHPEPWTRTEWSTVQPAEGWFRSQRGGEPTPHYSFLPGRELEFELMRTTKQTLDPHGLFNPGRLPFLASLTTPTRTTI